jgi:hypothetical protein
VVGVHVFDDKVFGRHLGWSSGWRVGLWIKWEDGCSRSSKSELREELDIRTGGGA